MKWFRFGIGGAAAGVRVNGGSSYLTAKLLAVSVEVGLDDEEFIPRVMAGAYAGLKAPNADPHVFSARRRSRCWGRDHASSPHGESEVRHRPPGSGTGRVGSAGRTDRRRSWPGLLLASAALARLSQRPDFSRREVRSLKIPFISKYSP